MSKELESLPVPKVDPNYPHTKTFTTYLRQYNCTSAYSMSAYPLTDDVTCRTAQYPSSSKPQIRCMLVFNRPFGRSADLGVNSWIWTNRSLLAPRNGSKWSWWKWSYCPDAHDCQLKWIENFVEYKAKLRVEDREENRKSPTRPRSSVGIRSCWVVRFKTGYTT